jgi:carbamoyl-phosphate synthase large subunit
LPFDRFPDVDTLLGPEMKSTGEVMGIGTDFGLAYAKAQLGAGSASARVGDGLHQCGMTEDKSAVLPVARQFVIWGSIHGHRRHRSASLAPAALPANGSTRCPRGNPMWCRCHQESDMQLIINTGPADEPRRDGYTIRRAALKFKVPYATTAAGALAVCRAIAALARERTL